MLHAKDQLELKIFEKYINNVIIYDKFNFYSVSNIVIIMFSI